MVSDRGPDTTTGALSLMLACNVITPTRESAAASCNSKGVYTSTSPEVEMAPVHGGVVAAAGAAAATGAAVAEIMLTRARKPVPEYAYGSEYQSTVRYSPEDEMGPGSDGSKPWSRTSRFSAAAVLPS